MAAANKNKKKLWKTGTNGGYITNLKQSILDTFDIYGNYPIGQNVIDTYAGKQLS
jgi:hypothetical protein